MEKWKDKAFLTLSRCFPSYSLSIEVYQRPKDSRETILTFSKQRIEPQVLLEISAAPPISFSIFFPPCSFFCKKRASGEENRKALRTRCLFKFEIFCGLFFYFCSLFFAKKTSHKNKMFFVLCFLWVFFVWCF